MKYKITDKISKDVIKTVLKVKNEKGLTAEAVVDEARNKSSPLHSMFDWNDTEAAEKWRIQQARVLINQIKVEINEKEYFAFENLTLEINESSNREYRTMVEIMSDKDMCQQMINKAYEQLLYWKAKYGIYTEFKEVLKAIQKVGKTIKK